MDRAISQESACRGPGIQPHMTGEDAEASLASESSLVQNLRQWRRNSPVGRDRRGLGAIVTIHGYGDAWMSHELLQEAMVFIGLMATLGAVTKIALTLISRRREPIGLVGTRLDEIAQRLARLEQAVDATAVEVERISEGQRFTTKLLADRSTTPR